ncbi:MAGUK p55 subfamily member 6-like isoform X2 [Centruroides sculpturatus]|uniref:MAGUK p55 subfamily member 6-like isoform X2 n=1 Tax=Centruroides sculpturatus TaxID=218467 RepID=UPI000C6EAE40|nr:MAGUK p55 subfamily member 6-like isoform X2 [Centruroides sculpturatus]XP_023224611.1 MAGUK p55 subfamily member 6-like isoform X2 [Centruroides sculpturatus]XP_023224612.1 MAGUK p55 subfamily member 6-like isoform X2 [Centruroides sculpturatus]XP_023224613.1 MAGUK p55 subfamily member 6-like isoform X2 [Centruroides sculpturatus]XP_023224614.1 MAGUK p55 subfamily member 6-like isoform X2 [Centruroides sculpturatus]XP_023224615.1 MAGUK p55 subfamily member 6-like isoform X2 [Centruroides s
MPTASGDTGLAAFQHVRENIEDLNGRVGARDTDLIFLKSLMESPVMSSIVKMQDRLEESNGSLKPVSTGNIKLVQDVIKTCCNSNKQEAEELVEILSDPYIQTLLEAHDTIASKSYEPPKPPLPVMLPSPPNNNLPSDDIRVVGIRKIDDDPLGITVREENGNLIIARILAGGIIDRQGLLHVGDIIMEVNDVEIHTPGQLQEQLKKAMGSVTFKIMPSYQDTIQASQCYVKALFSYDPSKDSLLPCKDIGLAFKQGDILQILNQEDPNWWQARKVNSHGYAGLIPSQELEERRRAFVPPEHDYATKTSMCGTKVTKKKRKTMYQSKANAEFDKAELLFYEEVARMPPFQRKTLVLIGAQGVGRRTMKSKLISSDPERFATPLPHTSRPIREGEQDGKSYYFVTREAMEADIAENKYLEWGEHDHHLYGTKLDSIRAIIRSGKMCVLDCNPQSLKSLKTSEFMPYVLFIAAPHLEQLRHMHEYGRHHGYSSRNLTFDRAMGRHGSRRARTLESLASLYEDEDLKKTIEESARLQRAYEKYFDSYLVNDSFDKTFEQLKDTIDALSTEPQWVPISWVY